MATKEPDPAVLRSEFWRLPPDAFVDRDTAGAALYLGRASMEVFAIRGGGPTYTRIGRRALYRKSDVLEWAAKNGQRVQSTAELASAGAAG